LNFFSGPDSVIKKSLSLTQSWRHTKKSSNPKASGLFQIETRRLSASLEGLSNSLDLSVGKL